jgi:protein-tyrosine phosphatase
MNTYLAGYSAESQSLGLAGIGNARELGGYRTTSGRTVRHGMLLRTAAPEGATEEDRRKLEHELHLSCVLDLRMDMEIQALDASARGLDFATRHHIDILDQDYLVRMSKDVPLEEAMRMSPASLIMAGIDQGIVSEWMYVDFLEGETGRRSYAELFSLLLAQPSDEALLFHCSQGKDRTGLAAMLILSVLGVDEQTIIFDYLLTNTFNAALIERERAGLLAHGVPEDQLDRYMLGFDQVYPQTMQNAIDHLKEAYGSVWGYVRDGLGLDEAARTELRAKYCTR